MVDDSVAGATKLLVGECFIDVDSGSATAFIQGALEEAKGRKERLEGELKRIEARQGELNKALYGRFGKSINLEE